jgi:membrane protein DedA with SNARE-associated domain
MFSQITAQILGLFSSLDYVSVVILMAIESSFVPLPSEIILPPAGWIAASGELNLWGIIIAATIGSLIGALFNYFLARTLGRKVIYKLARSTWAKFFLINEAKLLASEEYFRAHGKASTFIGRLVPGVRHLISIPAGLAKMNLWDFMAYTVAGAAIWSAILTLLGYWFGANQAQIKNYYHLIAIVGGSIFFLFVIYLIVKTKGKSKL